MDSILWLSSLAGIESLLRIFLYLTAIGFGLRGIKALNIYIDIKQKDTRLISTKGVDTGRVLFLLQDAEKRDNSTYNKHNNII